MNRLEIKQTYKDYSNTKVCICENITVVNLDNAIHYTSSKITIDKIEYNYIHIFFERSDIYGIIV